MKYSIGHLREYLVRRSVRHSRSTLKPKFEAGLNIEILRLERACQSCYPPNPAINTDQAQKAAPGRLSLR